MEPEIITNEKGGKQSDIGLSKMTEVPPLALIEVSKVMGYGSTRYPREADGTPNWYKIDCKSNLDHAMLHLGNYLAHKNLPAVDQKPEYLLDELSHFTARAMMGLEQFLRGTI